MNYELIDSGAVEDLKMGKYILTDLTRSSLAKTLPESEWELARQV